MTKTNPTYLGPLPTAAGAQPRKPSDFRRLARRIPMAFLLVVVAPTIIAAIYFLLIASPRFVSEARFVVRSSSLEQPSSLGIALQGVGIDSAQTDAFVVHEYIKSRDSLRELDARYDVAAMLARPGADAFSRVPRPWEGRTREELYKGFQRFVTVGYDSTTGISTLRVEGFRPGDAQSLNDALLSGGERLVNRLNQRASVGAVAETRQSVEEAQARLSAAQMRLTAFRNRERFIDPSRSATEGSALVGELLSTVAVMRAERAQIAQDAPSSPQLPLIDSRIRAFERQITTERAKIAGDANSLAPKIGAYEALTLEREFADRALTTATQSLDRAQLDARRQRLYLERVVNPSLPDKPSRPRRWLDLLTVFATTLLIYGTGWLIVAGFREHRQT